MYLQKKITHSIHIQSKVEGLAEGEAELGYTGKLELCIVLSLRSRMGLCYRTEPTTIRIITILML